MEKIKKHELTNHSAGRRRRALKAAFPYTIPIMAGFLFLGIAYGIYMSTSGFFFLYPTIMGLLIFGGSLEFVAVSMLLSPFAPLSAFVIAFMIQCRHLFYGIAMLDQYKGMGWKKFSLIFGLCDETFSLNYTIDIPEDIDRGWFMLSVTWLNRLYWVSGATIGGLAGSMIHFSTDGLSFVMTSMFVVIFLEQWRKEKVRLSALIGFGASAGCLFLFGADSFMVPTVITILVLLTIFRRPMENRYRHFEELAEASAATGDNSFDGTKEASEQADCDFTERQNASQAPDSSFEQISRSFDDTKEAPEQDDCDFADRQSTSHTLSSSFKQISRSFDDTNDASKQPDCDFADRQSTEETTKESAK